jgi:hypothetical protein
VRAKKGPYFACFSVHQNSYVICFQHLSILRRPKTGVISANMPVYMRGYALEEILYGNYS